MRKTLVITEKSSQANALKSGLDMLFEKKQYKGTEQSKIPSSYYESDEVIIVAAAGHLFELYDVKDYLGIEGKINWRDISDKIPYIPDRFILKVKPEFASNQFQLIKYLIHRDDVEKIYNCADPDAEGELLMREILSMAGNKKPVYRMETKSLVPSILADAFYNPYNSSNYNKLYFEALARQQTDWLTGINYTTMFTLKTGIFYPMGRVLYVIVLYVYNSIMAIKNFKPTTSYGVRLTIKRGNKKLSLNNPDISFKKEDKAQCEELCKVLNNVITVVTKVEKKKKNLSPKTLYTTSKLYADMSNCYGISMEDSAKAAQYLYEKGRIMYPRTECEYLQTSEIDNTRKTVENLAKAGYPVKFHTKKSVFNDEKCGKKGEGGHTALIVTNYIYTPEEFKDIPKTAQAAYLLILNRTVSNFCDAPDIDETKVDFQCGDYTFKATGNTINSKGFLEFEPRTLSDELPYFYEGEVIEDAKYDCVEKKTKAPPAPTQARLLAYLKNPFGDEDFDDNSYYDLVKKGCTIGTGDTMEATATKAVRYDYITQKKGVYDITQKGANLVELFKRLNFHNLDPMRTLELNKKIKAIGNRFYTLEQNKEDIRQELNSASYMLKNSNIVITSPDLTNTSSVVGKCPKCGSPVVEGQKNFYCTNKECTFCLFKKDNFFIKSFGREITKTMAKGLLSSKRTAKVTGIKSKNKFDENGKPKKYDLNITVDFGSEYPKYEIAGFTNRKTRKKEN